MSKRISIKYTLLATTVIAAITLFFIPIYAIVQKNVYINLEKRHMTQFYQSLVSSVDFSDSDSISQFIGKSDISHYRIVVYNAKQKRVFTNRRSWNKEERRKERRIPKEFINEYFPNGQPQYSQHEDNPSDANITLRKIYYNENQRYYIFIQESLRNIGSIFSYINRVLIILLLLYILVCMTALFFTTQKITWSIQKLASIVKKFADKDYSVRFDEPLPEDEVGSLAKDFNQMADTIQDNIHSISNYNFLLKEDLNHLKKYENLRRKFVRNTTHELKTPLAIISSNVEMMALAKDSEKYDYYYNSAMEEIQKMSSLITNFLKYSTSETKVFQADFENINLSEALEHYCDKIAPTMRSKKLTFVRRIEEKLSVYASPIHLEQIFSNFITNAIFHASQKGHILVSLEAMEDIYHFSVYNDGTPIPEDQLDLIWEEFYSVNDRPSSNAGLGLFIVKEISVLNHTNCGILNHQQGVEFWYDFIPAGEEATPN